MGRRFISLGIDQLEQLVEANLGNATLTLTATVLHRSRGAVVRCSLNVYAYVYGAGDFEAGTAPTRGRFTHLPIRPFLGLRAEY
jgi:hypothetical protein